jgi:hypothetical protein
MTPKGPKLSWCQVVFDPVESNGAPSTSGEPLVGFDRVEEARDPVRRAWPLLENHRGFGLASTRPATVLAPDAVTAGPAETGALLSSPVADAVGRI